MYLFTHQLHPLFVQSIPLKFSYSAVFYRNPLGTVSPLRQQKPLSSTKIMNPSDKRDVRTPERYFNFTALARETREAGASQPVVGDEVEGTVTRIAPYGAFLVLPGGSSGLLHISEISDTFIKSVSDHYNVGDKVKIRVISVDKSGKKISLSVRQALSSRPTGYERVVELGGDWGHPWNDDGTTKYMQLSSVPSSTRPHHWEPDSSIFKRFDEQSRFSKSTTLSLSDQPSTSNNNVAVPSSSDEGSEQGTNLVQGSDEDDDDGGDDDDGKH